MLPSVIFMHHLQHIIDWLPLRAQCLPCHTHSYHHILSFRICHVFCVCVTEVYIVF